MRSIVIFDTTMFQYERDAQRVYEAIIKMNITQKQLYVDYIKARKLDERG